MSNENYTQKVEFLVSTSAELITEKVNKWLEGHPEDDIVDIVPFMSYTAIQVKDKEKGAMMIGCMIKYYVIDFDSFDPDDGIL